MSAVEEAFLEMEAGITRAQSFARVLREVTEGKFIRDDPVLAGGIYNLACEVEEGINAAVDVWTKARGLKEAER